MEDDWQGYRLEYKWDDPHAPGGARYKFFFAIARTWDAAKLAVGDAVADCNRLRHVDHGAHILCQARKAGAVDGKALEIAQ